MLTEEQLALRESGIGGSDAASAIGVLPWKTPVKFWHEKTGRSERNFSDESKRKMKFGQLHEGFICDWWAEEMQLKIRRDNRDLRSNDNPFMRCYIDRRVLNQNDRTIVEAKNVDLRGTFNSEAWGETGTDQIPEYYMVQCQHNMYVDDAQLCWLVALIGGNDLRWYPIPRDDALIDMIIKRETIFWDCVLNDTPPDIMVVGDLDLLYSVDNGESMLATDEILQLHEELIFANDQAKEFEKGKDYLKFRLKSMMKENTSIVDGDNKPLVTWKKNKDSKKVDYEAALLSLCDYVTDEDEEASAALHRKVKKQHAITTPGARPFLTKEPK